MRVCLGVREHKLKSDSIQRLKFAYILWRNIHLAFLGSACKYIQLYLIIHFNDGERAHQLRNWQFKQEKKENKTKHQHWTLFIWVFLFVININDWKVHGSAAFTRSYMPNWNIFHCNLRSIENSTESLKSNKIEMNEKVSSQNIYLISYLSSSVSIALHFHHFPSTINLTN